MTGRGTLALAAIAIALGLYVWLVEIRGAEEKSRAEEAASTIVAIPSASVTGLSLQTSDGARAELRRAADGTWALESPVAYAADAAAVERALRALEKIVSTSAIDPKPTDLEPFGLGATRKAVEVRAGEAAPQSVYIGRNTPVGGGRYVEVASDPKRIFTVASASLADLEPSLVTLRDKRLLRTPASSIDELTVRSGGALVAKAKKTDAGWALVEPEAVPADADRIVRVLDDLALGRASAFVDEPGKAEAYGLANPVREVTVRAGDVEERLSIGTGDGKTWLARAGDPVVLQVNELVVTNLPATTFDYRAKRVLTLDVEQVKALELVFPRASKTERLKRDGETWTSETPGVALKAVEIDDLLYALAALDATSLIEASPDRAALGLEPALAVIRALDAKGALLGEISFGDPHPDSGLPASSSQSPLVWRVSNDLGREVPLSPEAFTNLLVQSSAPPAPAPGAPAEPPATP